MTFAATESGPQRAQRRLLGLRGLLADFAGERDRALADLRATLELPALPDDEDADAHTDLLVHLARLLAATDPAAASITRLPRWPSRPRPPRSA